MSLIVTAAFVAAAGLVWGGVISAAQRGGRRRDPDAASSPRPTMLGTRRQRLSSLRLAAGLAIAGVGLLSAGADEVGQVVMVVSVAVVIQVSVLALLARRRGRDSDGALNEE